MSLLPVYVYHLIQPVVVLKPSNKHSREVILKTERDVSEDHFITLKFSNVTCGEKLARIQLNLDVTFSTQSHASEGLGLLRCDMVSLV